MRQNLHKDAPFLAPARRWQKWRTGLLDTPFNMFLTLIVSLALLWVIWPLARWAIFDAVWSGTGEDCQASTGACWVFIKSNLRLMLFATYPTDLLWRPASGLFILISLIIASMVPRMWGSKLAIMWVAAPTAVCFLLAGFPSGARVSTNDWGGLPLTILIWTVAYGASFALAIPLALARRSSMGGIRATSIGFIELVRAMPMLVVLYVSSLIVPMALPFLDINIFFSVGVALTIFISCYLAEIVRAGIQSLPTTQEEAARALGLSYWQTIRLVILPQALRTVIPPLVNLGIGVFLSTPLVDFIGMTDFFKATRYAAAQDQLWPSCYEEAYTFAALVYGTLCFSASRYSLWLERRINKSHRR